MTAPGDRRSIAELQARYDLEPTLQDVYVEGPTDRALVNIALAKVDRGSSVRAYEINDIDIPSTLLEERALPISNKSRVACLADVLNRSSTRDLKASVVCLADLDLDGHFGRRIDSPLLVYTSGLSLDSVLVGEGLIEKLFTVVLLAPVAPGDLLRELLPILNERVLHRMACEELGIVPLAIELRRDCTYDGTTLRCDLNSFVRRLLQSASAAHLAGDFAIAVDRNRSAIQADPRYYVHVDDFVELLHFCSHRLRSRAVPDIAKFRRFLFGFLDIAAIEGLPEIREIADRFGLTM